MALLIDDHVQFQQEHKQLLTAQVVLTDRLDRLAQTVKEMADAQAKARKEQAEARKEQTEAGKSIDDRLNALINILDDLIRKRPPQSPS